MMVGWMASKDNDEMVNILSDNQYVNCTSVSMYTDGTNSLVDYNIMSLMKKITVSPLSFQHRMNEWSA